MKRKSIISSVLLLALCLSIIAGSTYAIFTSEANVDVVAKSGTVKVDVIADKLSLYSRDVLQAENVTSGEFENLGTAALVDNAVTLENVTPGDKVVIPVSITNKSNVAVKYRTVISVKNDTGLWEALTVTVDGSVYSGNTLYSDWKLLAPSTVDNTTPFKEFNIEVEFPYLEEDQNEYQAKSCEFSYYLEAVQGNADVTDPDSVVSGQAALDAAIAAGDSVVYIDEPGTYNLPSVQNRALTVVGAGEDTVLNCTVAGTDQKYSGIDLTVENLTVVGAHTANGGHYYGIPHAAAFKAVGCTFEDQVCLYADTVEFVNCTFNTDSEHAFWTYGAQNVTVTGCIFNYTDRAVNCYSDQSGDFTDITFNNCEFNYVGTAAAPEGAIEINSSIMTAEGVDLYINGCTAPTAGELWFIPHWDSLGGEKTLVCVDGEYYVGGGAKLLKALETETAAVKVNLFKDTTVDVGTGSLLGGAGTGTVTVDGCGNTLTVDSDGYRSYLKLENTEGTLVLKNMILANINQSGTHYHNYAISVNSNAVLENVTATTPINLGATTTATLTNVRFENIPAEYTSYALWIGAGANVTVDGGYINAGRAIKIYDEDVDAPALTALKVSNFKVTSAEKSAILVTSVAGADIALENLDITGVAADSVNAVWNDEERVDAFNLITVTGGTLVQE